VGSLVCRITTIVRSTARSDLHGARRLEKEVIGCIPVLDDGKLESDMLLSIRLPTYITEAYRARIDEGALFVRAHHVTVVAKSEIVVTNDNSTFSVVVVQPRTPLDPNSVHTRRLTTPAPSPPPEPAVGNKTIMIVRVTTSDGVGPDKTLEQLRDGFFRRTVCPKSQYSACSFGQLVWEDAGGLEVRLDDPISAYQKPSQLVSDAESKILSQLGISSVSSLADKVVFCQPPGVGNWLAVAGVDHWRVNMNNEWCSSLAAGMHEIGHTLGLRHSSEGSQAYGDRSGYMGSGGRQENYPQKCFNGYNSWRLGWYKNRQLTLSPTLSWDTTIKVAAFVHYDKAAPDEPVLVNVGDLYLLYNRAILFNRETEQAKNALTVTRRISSGSKRLSGLLETERFTVNNFLGSGNDLVIEVCARVDGGGTNGADIMIVRVGLGGTCSEANDQLPTVNTEPPPSLSPITSRPVAPAPDTSVPTGAGCQMAMLPPPAKCKLLRTRCEIYSDCCGALICRGSGNRRKCKPCIRRSRRCRNHSQCCGELQCLPVGRSGRTKKCE